MSTAYLVNSAFPNRLGVGLAGNGEAASGLVVVPPILYSGARYGCLVNEDLFGDPDNPGRLAVFKSVDNGASWTELDSAHAPIPQYNGDTGFNVLGYYPPEGGRYVYFSYLIDDFSDQPLVQRFDLQTETWGSPSTQGARVILSGGAWVASLTVRTNGDSVLFYKDFNEALPSYAIYNGAWGTPVPLADAPFSSSALVQQRDTADNHVLLWLDETVSPVKLYATKLSSVNVLSARADTGWQHSTSVNNACFPIWVATTSQFVMALVNVSTPSAISVLKIASNLGTFSIESAVPVSVQSPVPHYPRMALHGSTLYLSYNENQHLDAPSEPTLILYVTQAVGTTSWSAAVQVFDARADTFSPVPIPPAGGLQAYGGGFTVFSDGTLAWSFGTTDLTTLPFPNPDDFGNQNYYFEIVGTPSPPALTCPIGGATGTVGVAYSKQLVVTGGTGPFVYEVIAGSIPPGLSLDENTGIISGIPTTAATYNYTIRVTDSLGATADTSPGCPIVVAGVPSPVVSQTGTCRTILNLWQHSVSPQVETITDRNDDWTNCGTPGNKFFQGLRLNGDTFGVNKTIAIRDSDTLTLHTLQPSPMNHQGRTIKPYSFATPFNAHMVRRESLDAVPYRQFGIEYVWEATPEFTYTWKTQRTNHGLKGFHHVQQIIMTYCSNAPVTLTIISFDGTSPQVITLASTAGVFKKIVVVLTGNKGLLYEYELASTVSDSTGAFQVWQDQLEVRCGEWGRVGDYINYPLVGGRSGDQASL